MKKLISIIIPTFSRNKLLNKLIKSIITNKYYNESIEIIVVDNNPNKDFLKEASKENIIYLHEERTGVSYARNKGAAAANGKWLYFLDDDELIEEKTLLSAINICLLNENYIYTGKTILYYEEKRELYINDLLENYLSKIDYGEEERILNEKEWITAGNLLIKKEDFEKINGFNTELQRSGNNLMGNEDILLKKACEDIELKTKYIPGLNVLHLVPKERMKKEWFFKRAFSQGASNFLFNKMFNKNTIYILFKKRIELYILYILSLIHLNTNKRFFYKVIYCSRKGFFSVN